MMKHTGYGCDKWILGRSAAPLRRVVPPDCSNVPSTGALTLQRGEFLSVRATSSLVAAGSCFKARDAIVSCCCLILQFMFFFSRNIAFPGTGPARRLWEKKKKKIRRETSPNICQTRLWCRREQESNDKRRWLMRLCAPCLAQCECVASQPKVQKSFIDFVVCGGAEAENIVSPERRGGRLSMLTSYVARTTLLLGLHRAFFFSKTEALEPSSPF